MSATSIVPQPGGGGPSPPEYDLFIVHANADRAWVEGYLKTDLGLEPNRTITPREFDPTSDGQWLASGGADRMVRVWIVRSEALAEMVCGRVRHNLTMNEWHQFFGAGIPCERTCPDLPSGQGTPPNAAAAAPCRTGDGSGPR